MRNYSPNRREISREGEGFANRGVEFHDHFVTAGYTRDLALANESDPGSKFSEVADAGDWLVTVVDGGGDNGETITVADDQHGGILKILTNDASADGMNCQLNGESFKAAAGRKINFESRFAVGDADKVAVFLGLAITDTTVLAGCTDYVGFVLVDGTASTLLKYANGKDATGGAVGAESGGATYASTGTTLADDTFVTIGFQINGVTDIRYFVNGVRVAVITSNIPDNEVLTPTMAIITKNAAAEYMYVDYFSVVADS